MKTEYFDIDKKEVVKTVEGIVPLADKSVVIIDGETWSSYTPIFNYDTMTMRICIWFNPK